MKTAKKLFTTVAIFLATCMLGTSLSGCFLLTQDSSPLEAHECGSECPICEKCTDLECQEDVCLEKCLGHGDMPNNSNDPELPKEEDLITIPIEGSTRHYFDLMAGYGDVDNAAYNSDSELGLNYVSDLSWNKGSKITARIYSKKETQADVVIGLRCIHEIVTLTSVLSVSLNGEVLESEAQIPLSDAGENAEFCEVNLGRFWLSEGHNEFVITAYDSVENMDVASLIVYTEPDTELQWSETVGKGTYFSGIHESVVITGDYEKNIEQNCIRVAGYNPSSATFYIESAATTTAKLYISVNSMQKYHVITDYYQFTVNGNRITSTASFPINDVMWGNYLVLELCDIQLQEGVNEISFNVGIIAWDDAYNVRGLFIDAGETLLSYAQTDTEIV